MLNKKVIVITGGAGLLGKEFAKAILNAKGTPIIADIDKHKGLSTKKELNKLFPGRPVHYQFLDINDKNSINKLIKILKDKYGNIDALVNNAYPRNKNYGKKFEKVLYADFCENLNLNLGGYFLTSQQFLLHFKNQGYGNIVNISSIYGVIPPRFDIYKETTMTTPIEYVAIKSALINNEEVKLSGFGNFELIEKKERPGRNPKTGEAVTISARRVVTFRAGNKLRKKITSFDG